MTATTSRLSYASSPESDGEFCEAETPRASRTRLNTNYNSNTLGSVDGIGGGGKMPRSTSDPSLAPGDEEDNSGGYIPDYNAPPPYAMSLGKVILELIW